MGAEACCTSACVEGLFAAEASGLVAGVAVTQQSAAATRSAVKEREEKGVAMRPSSMFLSVLRYFRYVSKFIRSLSPS